MSATRYELHGEVAVITLDNPPVNGLGYALRSGISEGLQRAQDDAAVRAIILIATANGFSGGADVKEFGTPLASAAPSLRALVSELEESSKPVIAAIAGIAMGGGLELALGCHYRVVVRDARIALPEVKLGLLPGAAGTQRLPRVIGLERALNARAGRTAAPAGGSFDAYNPCTTVSWEWILRCRHVFCFGRGLAQRGRPRSQCRGMGSRARVRNYVTRSGSNCLRIALARAVQVAYRLHHRC